MGLGCATAGSLGSRVAPSVTPRCLSGHHPPPGRSPGTGDAPEAPPWAAGDPWGSRVPCSLTWPTFSSSSDTATCFFRWGLSFQYMTSAALRTARSRSVSEDSCFTSCSFSEVMPEGRAHQGPPRPPEPGSARGAWKGLTGGASQAPLVARQKRTSVRKDTGPVPVGAHHTQQPLWVGAGPPVLPLAPQTPGPRPDGLPHGLWAPLALPPPWGRTDLLGQRRAWPAQEGGGG